MRVLFLCTSLWVNGVAFSCSAADLAAPVAALPSINANGVSLKSKSSRTVDASNAYSITISADQADLDMANIDAYNRSIGLTKSTLKFLQLGNEQYDRGNFEYAVACFERAIKLNCRYASAFNNRGNARDALGDTLGAEQDYKRAIELNPKFASPHNNLGCQKIGKNDLVGAIAEFKIAIRVAPDCVTLDNLGCALERTGDLKGALHTYSRAIDINPKYSLSYVHRALLRDKLGDFDNAMQDHYRIVELAPRDAYSYWQRGFALHNATYRGTSTEGHRFLWELQRQLSIDDFTKAIEIDPGFVRAYQERGFARAGNNDYAGAVHDYDQVVRLSPKSALNYQIRSFFRDGLGDVDGAIEDLDKAISRNTVAPYDAYLNRGTLRAVKGDYLGAIHDFWSTVHFQIC